MWGRNSVWSFTALQGCRYKSRRFNSKSLRGLLERLRVVKKKTPEIVLSTRQGSHRYGISRELMLNYENNKQKENADGIVEKDEFYIIATGSYKYTFIFHFIYFNINLLLSVHLLNRRNAQAETWLVFFFFFEFVVIIL